MGRGFAEGPNQAKERVAMTNSAARLPEPPPSDPANAVSVLEVTARLAQRLCHDFMSPASGIISGLDLLEDPGAQDLREEAMGLIATSARKLVDSLTFARAAFGSGFESFDNAQLETLARGLFSHLRPRLEWAVESPTLAPTPARILLNLVQLAGGALAIGGVARVTTRMRTDWSAIIVDAIGERARLHPEVAAGIRGEAMGEGLSGRWVQAWFVHALVSESRGFVAAEVTADGVAFKAALPA
jgi:histidine phosphotransferase ChpT